VDFPSDNLTNGHFDYVEFCNDKSPPAHRPGPSGIVKALPKTGLLLLGVAQAENVARQKIRLDKIFYLLNHIQDDEQQGIKDYKTMDKEN
jgi:hypothetical protein